MSGPRQQITGLSNDATLDRMREPGGHSHRSTFHRIKPQRRVTAWTQLRWSGLDWNETSLECGRNAEWRDGEEGTRREHTFLLAVAVELCDRVHRRGKVKVSAVPRLKSHSVVSLSTKNKQHNRFPEVSRARVRLYKQ